MTVSHETFWGTIPTGRNIFCQRRVVIKASATSEISEFNDISRNKDVLSTQGLWLKNSCYLRLYVTMEDGVLVHMLNGFEQLEDLALGGLEYKVGEHLNDRLSSTI